MMPKDDQLALFEPRSEIPELEEFGLRAETLLYRPRGHRAGGVRSLYVFGRGLVDHSGTLESLGFRSDPIVGGFYKQLPVDSRRLLMAVGAPPVLAEDAAPVPDVPAEAPEQEALPTPATQATPAADTPPPADGGIFTGWNLNDRSDRAPQAAPPGAASTPARSGSAKSPVSDVEPTPPSPPAAPATAQGEQQTGAGEAARDVSSGERARATGSLIPDLFEAPPVTTATAAEIERRLASRRHQEAATAANMAASVSLGVNALGHVVYETRAGQRFYRDNDGVEIGEAEAGAPGLFLRAASRSDLDEVARGVLYQPVHGQAFSCGDLDETLRAIQAGDSSPETTRAALLYAVWHAAHQMLSNAASRQQARALAGRLHRLTQNSFAAIRGELPSLPVMNMEREIRANATIDVPAAAAIDETAVLAAAAGENDRVLIRVAGAGANGTDLRSLLGNIPAHCIIEGAVAISPPLAEAPALFVVIGGRRPEPVDPAVVPDQAFEIVRASDPEGLIAALDAVHVAKKNTAEWFDRIRSGEPVEDIGDQQSEAEPSQVPYQPMSRGVPDGLMIPVNLSEPTREAQAALRARRGDDIDAWVAEHVGFEVPTLHQVVAAEQIDTIATALDCHARGKAGLVGNATGTGKGRIGGAIIHAKVRAGKKVLVLSERPEGIGTLLRDMRNLGVLDGKRMFLLNAGTEVRDATTGASVFEKRSVNDVKADCTRDGAPAWPDDVDIVFGTYSQFNRTAEQSWRVRWLDEVVNRDVSLVFDEAHVVASASANWSENMIGALSNAGDVTYITATWVGASDKAAVYYRLLGENLPPEAADKIPEVLAKGGEPAQDAFGAMLARDGVMSRLESSLADIQLRLCASPNLETNRDLYNRIAPIFAEMMRYARAVRNNAEIEVDASLADLVNDQAGQARVMAELAQTLRARGAAVPTNERDMWRKVRRNSMLRTMSFGSPLFRLSRALMAAIMVNDEQGVVEEAINRIRDGIKPVLVFQETADALVSDLVKQAREAGFEVPERPDFKHMLRAALRVAGRAHRRNGDVVVLDADDRVVRPDEERQIAGEIVKNLADVVAEEAEAGAFAAREDADPPAAQMEASLLRRVSPVVDHVITLAEQNRDDGQPLNAEAVRNFVTSAIRSTFLSLHTDIANHIFRLREHAEKLGRAAVDLRVNRHRIEDMIDDLPDLPMNFIDRAKQKIMEAGYSVGEITGRQFTVNPDGSVDRRVREPTDIVARKFNSGEYTALVMNAAGASMIDLHSSEEFPDQSQRALMIVQTLPATVLTQVLGRVNRRGQVVPPLVEMHVPGLPVTYRFIAALNMQCERLGANVSAIRKHPLMCDAIAPVLSRDGDIAAARFLLNNPDLRDLLEIDAPIHYLTEKASFSGMREEEGKEDRGGVAENVDGYWARQRAATAMAASTRDNRRLANEILARSTCFDTTTQGQVIRLMEAEYWGWMEERAALGVYTGGRHQIEGKVVRRIRVPIDPGDAHMPADRRSAFDAPLYLEGLTVETQTKPLRASDVKTMVAAAIPRGDEHQLRKIENSARASGARVRVEDQGMLGEIEEFNAGRNNQAAEVLSRIRIGGGLSIVVDGERIQGIVVGCAGRDWIEASISVVYPGGPKPISIRVINAINAPTLYAADEGLHGPDRKARLEAFDDVAGNRQLTPRWALTGNLWKALQGQSGRVVSWGDGGESGVLLPRSSFPPEMVMVPLTSAENLPGVLAPEGLGPGMARSAVLVEIKPALAGVDSGVYAMMTAHRSRGDNADRYMMEITGMSVTGGGRNSAYISMNTRDIIEEFAGGTLRRMLNDEAWAKVGESLRDVEAKLGTIADLEHRVRNGETLSREEKRLLAGKSQLRHMSRYGVSRILTSSSRAIREPEVTEFVAAALREGARIMVRRDVRSLTFESTLEWVRRGGEMPPRFALDMHDIPGAEILAPSPLERPAPAAPAASPPRAPGANTDSEGPEGASPPEDLPVPARRASAPMTYPAAE